MQQQTHDLHLIAPLFRLYGKLQSFGRYGSGHINDTYAAVYDQAGTAVRYIHQRLNTDIFKSPQEVMANIERVTCHQNSLLKKTQQLDASRRALTLVPAADNRCFAVDQTGGYWRTYLFIEKATTHNSVNAPTQAYEAARAFGRFQRDLLEFPADELYETVPHFHDTPKRFENLQAAVTNDECGRAKQVAEEIEFALAREALAETLTEHLAAGNLPLRVTHNDTKINNVMLDDKTGEGICVIDLDTVMPGCVLHDFGDLVRTCTCPAREDTTNLQNVVVHLELFEAVVNGYLSAAAAFLTPVERSLLVESGRLITFEIGIRFLTDYLQGDKYFKTHRPNQNLDRCRTQFALVHSLEKHDDALRKIVAKAATHG